SWATAWRPSPRIRGVPTSSQSTPALTAISAVGSASAIVWRSSDSWTFGFPSSRFFFIVLPSSVGDPMAPHGTVRGFPDLLKPSEIRVGRHEEPPRDSGSPERYD